MKDELKPMQDNEVCELVEIPNYFKSQVIVSGSIKQKGSNMVKSKSSS